MENRWDSIACVRHVSESLGEAKTQGNKGALTKRSLHVRMNSHHVKERIWSPAIAKPSTFFSHISLYHCIEEAFGSLVS